MAPTTPTKAPKRPVDVRVDQAEKNLQRAQEAAAATPPAQAEREKHIVVLDVGRLKGAEFERVVHVATPGAEHTRQDMLNPAYWAHVSPKLKPWDRIEVRPEGGLYYAELLVLACDRAWARVHVLRWEDLSSQDVSLTAATSASAKFEVRHSPNLRWHVVRKSDRQLMHQDDQTEQDAQLWLREYLKTVPA